MKTLSFVSQNSSKLSHSSDGYGDMRSFRIVSRTAALAASMSLTTVVASPVMAEVLGTVSGRGFIEPAGPVAQAQLHHFGVIVAIMMLVLVPIFIAVPILIWRYRRGGNGAYRPKWDFNSAIESTIWGFPIVIVAILGVALWNYTFRYDPYQPLGDNPLEVQVIALDWKFLFLYPEQGIATVDFLAIPEGRPVTLKLTSGTVMQSFMIPQLAGQIYTMAGMQTQLNLRADTAGHYVGRNTQYNGNGFHEQSFLTKAMVPSYFDQWVELQKARPNRLDWAGYEGLLKPSVINQPIIYGGFEPDLYTRVLASFVPAIASMNHHDGHGTAQSHEHGQTESYP